MEAEVAAGVEDPPLLPPPAPEASCANPTDIGFWRNTEYTFFKNVSPTTQLGFPDPALVPRERSNMAPTHIELPCSTGPKFMSCVLIGHAWPPNDKVTLTDVVQGNWKNPCWPRMALAPGTAAQMAFTPSVGPPNAVVPVSIAVSAASPVAMVTDFPCTVTADKDSIQKVGVDEPARL